MLLKGTGASPGFVIGKARIVDHGHPDFSHYRLSSDEEVRSEIAALHKALEESKAQLLKAKGEAGKKAIQDARQIIDTHILILQDKILLKKAVEKIKTDRVDAAWALKETMQSLKDNVAALSDSYLQERSSDISFIERRILRNLSGKQSVAFSKPGEKVIIVASDLSPADTANLDVGQVLGFITEYGGKTSHTAIMARALQIPSVVGLKDVLQTIKNGDELIIDGVHGVVIVNPDAETRMKYLHKKEQHQEFERKLLAYKDLPAESLDGFKIALRANIEIVEELSSVIDFGGEGIGLFRTEFLYINKPELPGEEELFAIFKTVAEIIAPNPVTIRTLDIGGDKFISPVDVAEEMNPVMGLRAIRFCLKEIHIFKTQLRAILRASAFGKVKIMFPMISCVEEVLKIKTILREVKAELRKEQKAFDPRIEIGIMVEVPSAATIADLLAREVHFFSIGTNDLIQYLIAIDRINEQVSYLYEPLHPAVLRLLQHIINAAHNNGIPVAMCGEMAGEPEYMALLLGLGIDELSMNPIAILEAKKTLRALNYQRCRELVEKMFTLPTAAKIRAFLSKNLHSLTLTKN